MLCRLNIAQLSHIAWFLIFYIPWASTTSSLHCVYPRVISVHRIGSSDSSLTFPGWTTDEMPCPMTTFDERESDAERSSYAPGNTVLVPGSCGLLKYAMSPLAWAVGTLEIAAAMLKKTTRTPPAMKQAFLKDLLMSAGLLEASGQCNTGTLLVSRPIS